MNCPKCGSKLDSTHVYGAGDSTTHRLKCLSKKCGAVVTAVTVVVSTDSLYGGGAAALAKAIKAQEEQSLEGLVALLKEHPMFRAPAQMLAQSQSKKD